jgi:hypothetical protein
MQNNSTLAIEEVDEDEYKEVSLAFPKIHKPVKLPSLSTCQNWNGKKTKGKTRNKFGKNKQKCDSWIFIEDN